MQDEIKVENIYCHTDSQICLSWLRAIMKDFKPFVQNRVNKVRRSVMPENWFYCRTGDKSADLSTRADNEGVNSTLWWEGPEFLKTSDSSVPGLVSLEKVDFDNELKEIKSSSVNNASIDNLININK